MSLSLDCDVAIVGAGPVGLMCAALLAQTGHSAMLIEQRNQPRARSQAIGIMPPSLRIFDALGLAGALIEAGTRIDAVRVFESGDELGRLSFSAMPSPFPFVLSVPQTRTEEILRAALNTRPGLTQRLGTHVSGVTLGDQHVTLSLHDASGSPSTLRASLLIGCDGCRSDVRQALGIGLRSKDYARYFAMADAPEQPELAEEARLYFSPTHSVESFPLPVGRRRWIVSQAPGSEDVDAATLAAQIEQHTALSVPDLEAPSCFRPQRAIATRFFLGRAALCGDAAHVMSPIGGQGMNTGFADAAAVCTAVSKILDHGTSPAVAFADYARRRRPAARIASRRAAQSMWLGTLKGVAGSALRRTAVRMLIHTPALHRRAARRFAMSDHPAFNVLTENGVSGGVAS